MFETTVQRALIRGRAPATIVRPQPVEPPWPEVTVVVPCYNYGRYLEDSVGSVLSQSEVEVRVVIIDDASPDGSAHIAERIAQRDSRVSLIRHETNAGHIATYNEGLGATQSEFVALLSADDLLTPGALGRATALMRAFPSVGFTYGRPVVFQGEVPPPARTKARTWTVWKGSDWIADRCRIGRNAIWAPEAVMRTSVLKEAGLFDAEHPHSGDLDLWLRMARISDVGLISGADQGWYREHLASMSRTTFAGQITDLKARRRTFKSAVASLPNSEELFQQAELALAREAVRTAFAAQAQPSVREDVVEELVAFARSTWPDADTLPEARFLRSAADPPSSMAGRVVQSARERLELLRGTLKGRIRTWRSHVTGV